MKTFSLLLFLLMASVSIATPTIVPGALRFDMATIVNGAAYSVDQADCVLLVDCSGASVAITLPSAEASNGRVLLLQSIGAHGSYTITLDGYGTDTIDDEATDYWSLGAKGDSLWLWCDGWQWRKISQRDLDSLSCFDQFAGDGSDGAKSYTTDTTVYVDEDGLQMTDLTIPSGVTVTLASTAPSCNGIFRLGVRGTATIAGTLSADGLGIAGSAAGARVTTDVDGVAAAAGSSVSAGKSGIWGGYVSQATGGGGGGGASTSGGAGGARAFGVPWDVASAPAGGSSGTIGTTGTAGTTETTAPGWWQRPRFWCPGVGGTGGGSGGGAASGATGYVSGAGGAGGAGGGCILLEARKIVFTGTITANGSAGASGETTTDTDAAGGGGGGGGQGGRVVVRYLTGTNSATVTVTGGAGGAGGVGDSANGGAGGAGCAGASAVKRIR